jgi:ankyrin repeat protein
LEVFDGDGGTALMWAASHGSIKCVEVLLAMGADAMGSDKDGKSARDWALKNEEPECAMLLEKSILEKNTDKASMRGGSLRV